MRLFGLYVRFTYGGYLRGCFIPMYSLPRAAVLVSQNSEALEQIPIEPCT